MSTVVNSVGSIPSALSKLGHRVAAATRTLFGRRANARARAICPVDSWAFTPLYSNGACPLCGWKPEAYVYKPPFLTPYERYWGALGGIVALSVVMAIVVVIAYTQT